ncbi:hypothetical protein BV898_03307 [Hypsibius exemplaris]|uniref:GTP cyclohydrolase 1 feedback regulatory protein n=1 Tax=Hypsibius exemplaris TaxID=2072580 RepID=A0A1W0X5U9_HYPEX|nr:hypothetical protein BV898_03307 [Hypsibius exemplaris]
MPYVIIEYKGGCGGVTWVGDPNSDPGLMQFLGARLHDHFDRGYEPGYLIHAVPRIVLNKLETVGYKLLAMSATHPGPAHHDKLLVWTLHKPEAPPTYSPGKGPHISQGAGGGTMKASVTKLMSNGF